MLDMYRIIENIATDNGLPPEELLEACKKRQQTKRRNRKRQQTEQAERDRDRGELLPEEQKAKMKAGRQKAAESKSN